MQRWIWAILAAAVFVSPGAVARAAETFSPNYDGRLLRRHQDRIRKERAEELLHERARIRARERYNGKWPARLSEERTPVRKSAIRR